MLKGLNHTTPVTLCYVYFMVPDDGWNKELSEDNATFFFIFFWLLFTELLRFDRSIVLVAQEEWAAPGPMDWKRENVHDCDILHFALASHLKFLLTVTEAVTSFT